MDLAEAEAAGRADLRAGRARNARACSRARRPGGRTGCCSIIRGGARAAASCVAPCGRSTAPPRPMRSIASTRGSSVDRRAGHLLVVEAMGASPQATHAIWRFLLEIDLVASVKATFLPIDHPLLLSLAAPRRLNFLVREGLWVRLDRRRRGAVGARLCDRRDRRDRRHRRILSVERRPLACRARRRSRRPAPKPILPATSARSAVSISAASPLRSSPARCACGIARWCDRARRCNVLIPTARRGARSCS